MEHDFGLKRHVQRYFEGIAGEEERKYVEKELENNPELQQELGMHKRMHEALHDERVLDLYSKMDAMFDSPSSKTRLPVRRLAVVATSIAATLVLGILTFNKPDAETIIKTYYQAASNHTVYRSLETAPAGGVEEAMFAYTSQDYERAAELFKIIIQRDKQLVNLNLYAGISYFEQGMYTDALTCFDALIAHGEGPFVESARWYKGFTHLKLDETEASREVFQTLSEEQGYYQGKANKIYRKLK